MNTYNLKIVDDQWVINIFEHGNKRMRLYQDSSVEVYETVEALEEAGYHPWECLGELGYLRKLREMCQCGKINKQNI